MDNYLNSNPKISVLMPVCNTKEEYLREAIESILTQTYTNFEFIILNDCSTNNVESIILSYKDERIKYYQNDFNMGISESTNRLLSLASCELIFMSDHDDISLPTRFEKQVKFMEEHPEVGVLSAGLEYFPEVWQVIHPIDHQAIEKCLLFGLCIVANPCAVIRKSLIEKSAVKYEKEYDVAQDYRLWTNLIGQTKFANLPEILLKYRWHKNNFSKINNFKQIILTQKIIFLAQESYFHQDFNIAVNLLDKLLTGKIITSSELKQFIISIYQVKTNAMRLKLDYALNRHLYKLILSRTKKDTEYLKILWQHDLSKELKIKKWFKLKNTVKI